MINFIFFGKHGLEGGGISMARHLWDAMNASGENARAICLAESKSRKTTQQVSAYNIPLLTVYSVEELIRETSFGKSIIVVVPYGNGNVKSIDNACKYIRETGTPVIMHSTKTLVPELMSLVAEVKSPVIRARDKSLDTAMRGMGIDWSVHIPIPYTSLVGKYKAPEKRSGAVSMSRLDFGKKVERVVAANKLLEASGSKLIEVYGTISSRYAYFALDTKFDGWRNSYRGEYADPYPILLAANYSVDMSHYKLDGGDPQYTFLEAMDCGAVPIISREWLEVEGEMVEGRNCLAAGSPEELAGIVMKDPPDMSDAFRTVLLRHAPIIAGRQWCDYINTW